MRMSRVVGIRRLVMTRWIIFACEEEKTGGEFLAHGSPWLCWE